jgi:exodeoxyribonuclease V gamma subunit
MPANGARRTAHRRGARTRPPPTDALPPYDWKPDYRLKLGERCPSFLRQPARYFFRRRLGVNFAEGKEVGEDEEPFSLDALERYFLEDELLDDSGNAGSAGEVRQVLDARAQRLVREGRLPIGLVGKQWQQQLVEAWCRCGAAGWRWARAIRAGAQAGGEPGSKRPGMLLDDWIDKLRSNDGETVWLMQISSRVLDRKGAPRGDKLIGPWLRQLAAACERRARHRLPGGARRHAQLDRRSRPIARWRPGELVALWRANLDQPLAVACKTALAHLAGGDPREAYDGGFEIRGEVDDPCLARLWPEFAVLRAAGDWPRTAEALYGPLAPGCATAWR